MGKRKATALDDDTTAAVAVGGGGGGGKSKKKRVIIDDDEYSVMSSELSQNKQNQDQEEEEEVVAAPSTGKKKKTRGNLKKQEKAAAAAAEEEDNDEDEVSETKPKSKKGGGGSVFSTSSFGLLEEENDGNDDEDNDKSGVNGAGSEEEDDEPVVSFAGKKKKSSKKTSSKKSNVLFTALAFGAIDDDDEDQCEVIDDSVKEAKVADDDEEEPVIAFTGKKKSSKSSKKAGGGFSAFAGLDDEEEEEKKEEDEDDVSIVFSVRKKKSSKGGSKKSGTGLLNEGESVEDVSKPATEQQQEVVVETSKNKKRKKKKTGRTDQEEDELDKLLAELGEGPVAIETSKNKKRKKKKTRRTDQEEDELDKLPAELGEGPPAAKAVVLPPHEEKVQVQPEAVAPVDSMAEPVGAVDGTGEEEGVELAAAKKKKNKKEKEKEKKAATAVATATAAATAAGAEVLGDHSVGMRITVEKKQLDNVYAAVDRDTKKKISVCYFKHQKEANAYERKMRRLASHSYMIKPLFSHQVHLLPEQLPLVVTDYFPSSRSFSEWLCSPMDIWRYQKKGSLCIGFSDEVLRVFKSLMKSLQSLHKSGFYHGNIRDGIRICESGVMFSTCKDDTGLITGIWNDLQDVKALVEELANTHPPSNARPYPPAYEMFKDDTFSLVTVDPKQPKLVSKARRRKFAFFLYNNPLFFDDYDNCKFVLRLWEFGTLSPSHFRTKWKTIGSKFQSKRWWRAIQADAPMKKVYNYRMKKWTKNPNDIYLQESGLLEFMRNLLAHYTIEGSYKDEKGRNMIIRKGIYYYAIAGALHDLFPDAVPKFFLRMIELFYNPTEEKIFGCDLVEFLEIPPMPF